MATILSSNEGKWWAREREKEVMTDDLVKVGDQVEHTGQDSRFKGVVVAVFPKLNDQHWRCVVENKDGILHIYNAKGFNND